MEIDNGFDPIVNEQEDSQPVIKRGRGRPPKVVPGSTPPVLEIYRTNPDVNLPAFATEGSACFDVAFCRAGKSEYSGFTLQNKAFTRGFNKEGIYVGPGERVMVPTGLIFKIPEKFSLRLHIRSSLAMKRGLTLVNAEGVIDSDFFHETFIVLHNVSQTGAMIADGERLAQAELVPVLEYLMAETTTQPQQTTNRVGGYGSTGK